MLQPFLVIGLGGSGGKTLQTLRDDVERMLRQRGWTSGLPAAWQLLQIDIPPTPGEIERDLPEPLTGDRYLGLAKKNVGYEVIDHSLEERLSNNSLARQATAGWRPSAHAVTVPVEKGAGQYRAIGRVLTVAYIEEIKAGIDRAIARMEGASTDSELRQVARLLGHRSEGKIEAPAALVVSSIAGGTGAGMIMDVCDILRLTGRSWAGESYGMLFTPEVFDELPEAFRQGVRPNAFATLSEILAGFWDKDGFGDDESALLRMAGVNPGATTRLGPRYPILVGQSNGTVRLNSQNDVYRAAGRALSAWMLSEQVQSELRNYFSGNWAQSSAQADLIPFKQQGQQETQESPFQAIGFSRVSLGRDRFFQYSAQYLARQAVDRLREGHLEDSSEDDHRSDDTVIKEAVEEAWPEFLALSGFDLARGEVYAADGTSTPLIDSVRSKDVGRGQGRDLADQVLRGLAPQFTVEQQMLHINESVRNRQREEIQKYLKGTQEGVREWVAAVQEGLVRQSLSFAASRGLPVAIELLRRLARYLPTVAKDVHWQAERYRQGAAPIPNLDPSLSLTPDSPAVKQFVTGKAMEIIRQADAELLDQLAELLLDAKDGLVLPLASGLEGSLSEVQALPASGAAGADSDYRLWPDGADVPRRLRPTPNERTLLDPSEFHRTLMAKLAQQLRSSTPGASVDAAIRQIVLLPLDGRKEAREQVFDQMWVPKRSEFRPGEVVGAPSKLRLALRQDPRLVLLRSERWIEDPQSPLGRFVSETLAEYLSEERESRVLEERVVAFGRELGEAIKASAPLVAVDSRALAIVHPGLTDVPNRTFSGFPFPMGSRAAEVTSAVLHDQAGLSQEDREKLMGVANPDPHVDIFATLPAPMEAAVFDSLMKPMGEEWVKARSGGADALAKFWRFRRSRPLPQFVPMSPFVRQAMVRGWFTANLLGQVQQGPDGETQVFFPAPGEREGRYVSFPDPLLLPEGYRSADRIAGILKSALVAMININVHGTIEPVYSYRRLLDLGKTRSGAIMSYDQLNAELEAWVRQAKLPKGAPVPQQKWAGGESDTWEQRRDALALQVAKWAEGYQSKVFDPVDKMHDLTNVPRSWELRRDYMGALESILATLRNMQPEDDGDLV